MDKMNNLSDLRKYKKAIVVHKDLETCIKIMSLAIQGLSNYSKYIPVLDSFATLQKNKAILEIYLDKCDKIIKEKGKVEENG